MIATHHTCVGCDSENSIKNGKNAPGPKRYKCKDCGVTRVPDSKQAHAKVDMEVVQRTFGGRFTELNFQSRPYLESRLT